MDLRHRSYRSAGSATLRDEVYKWANGFYPHEFYDDQPVKMKRYNGKNKKKIYHPYTFKKFDWPDNCKPKDL